MRQQPIGSLATLRKSPIKINRRLRPGVTKLHAISPFGNVYEMKLAIKTDKPDICGVNICSGNGYKVTISYDSQTKYLVVDRTASTDVSIPKFDRISHTRIPDKNGILDLDIFVDMRSTHPPRHTAPFSTHSFRGIRVRARGSSPPVFPLYAHSTVC